LTRGQSVLRSGARLANNLGMVDRTREPASMLDFRWPTIRCEIDGSFRCEKSATHGSHHGPESGFRSVGSTALEIAMGADGAAHASRAGVLRSDAGTQCCEGRDVLVRGRARMWFQLVMALVTRQANSKSLYDLRYFLRFPSMQARPVNNLHLMLEERLKKQRRRR